ncbi:DNA topoisomerase [Vibrio tritonius]|uniref:DNA topoisomerase n=1 Tax=Vibrio tritonius TaxID=1435069 RepID=UPI00315D8444
MDVYVAEKHAVAEAIARVLSDTPVKCRGYYDCSLGVNKVTVTWLAGHVLSLKEPHDFKPEWAKWKLEQLPLNWPIAYKVSQSTQNQFKIVSELLQSKETTKIISCTDPDKAGQMIADELFQYLHLDSNIIFRAMIDDLNRQRVISKLSNLRPNTEFKNLSLQEEARAVGDQRLGINLTRLVALHVQSAGIQAKIVVGRVKAAIISLVVCRERERQGFSSTDYYLIDTVVNSSAGQLKARLDTKQLPQPSIHLSLDDKSQLIEKEQVTRLANMLNSNPAVLVNKMKKEVHDSPPLPFDLLSLQVECSRLFKMSPSRVMDITQQLRLPPYSAITYNRSDCRYIPNEHLSECNSVIIELSKIDALHSVTQYTDSTIKSRAFNSAKIGAHSAIIPTGNVEGYDKMDDETKLVFLLISRQYLIQFLPKRIRNVVTYQYKIDGYLFEGKFQNILSYGWSAIFQNDQESEGVSIDSEGETAPIDISDLLVGGKSDHQIVVNPQKSKPRPSYTMTTLLKDLTSCAKYASEQQYREWLLQKDQDNEELGGIGTPATRSDILDDIFTAKLLIQQRSKTREIIIPSDAGYLLHDVLPSDLVSPNLTSIWANWFRQIGTGDKTVNEFLDYVDAYITNTIHTFSLASVAPSIANLVHTVDKPVSTVCPKCLSNSCMSKSGKFGKYWQCSKCNETFDDLKEAPIYRLCSKCGAKMRLRKAKGSVFFGCSNYPRCNRTEQV